MKSFVRFAAENFGSFRFFLEKYEIPKSKCCLLYYFLIRQKNDTRAADKVLGTSIYQSIRRSTCSTAASP